HLLDGDHIEPSYDFIVFGLVQGDQLGQRTRRNDYSRGMHAGVADQAFQLARGIQQLPDLAVAFVRLLQSRRILNGPIELYVELVRHHLGDTINVAIGNVHCPADIFDSGLGGHGAERDDLRHILPAIFARDVIDDFATPVHAEINVNVRHGEALARDVLEVAVERIAVRHVKMREGIFNFLQPHTAALGDSEGAREHVRRVFEDSVHLVVTLDIEAGTLELHSVRLLNALAGLN